MPMAWHQDMLYSNQPGHFFLYIEIGTWRVERNRRSRSGKILHADHGLSLWPSTRPGHKAQQRDTGYVTSQTCVELSFINHDYHQVFKVLIHIDFDVMWQQRNIFHIIFIRLSALRCTNLGSWYESCLLPPLRRTS